MFVPISRAERASCYDLLLEIDLQRESESKFLSEADGLFIVCHAGLARLLKMFKLVERKKGVEGGKSFSCFYDFLSRYLCTLKSTLSAELQSSSQREIEEINMNFQIRKIM